MPAQNVFWGRSTDKFCVGTVSSKDLTGTVPSKSLKGTVPRPPIIHVIPHLWSGAGAVVTRLCEAQRRHGPVSIVTAGGRGAEGDWGAYRARLRRAGVDHRTIDFFSRDQGTFWASTSALTNLIRDIEPAVIHAHAGVPACGAAIARGASGHRARMIGQMYSWGPNRPDWMNEQDVWGLAQSDRVVCSAHAYRDLLIHNGVPARKLTYLPWGLPLDELPWRSDAARATSPTIGFVGRIEPRKGQLELVKAFAGVRKVHPAARLELVGPVADESYAATLRAQVTRAKLGAAITMGPAADAIARLRRWDLFVSLSSDEGQGLAVLEAMATGVPVLARPVAGISDFLADGKNGIALTSSSATDVADAIISALSSRARLRAITRRARRMVERRYSWDRTIAAFDRLYWQ